MRRRLAARRHKWSTIRWRSLLTRVLVSVVACLALSGCFEASQSTAPRDPPTSFATSTVTNAWGRGLAWYAANTGVPAGTALGFTGPLILTAAGTVLDGMVVNGGITVAADNVTIRNSRVMGTITVSSGFAVINHVEVDLDSLPIGLDQQHGIWVTSRSAGTIVTASKIHGMQQGIAWSGNLTASDNWIYNVRANRVDHADGILSNGPTGTSYILRNWIDSSGVGAISGPLCMYGDFGRITNVTVAGNLMTGTGANYFGAVAEKTYPRPLNVIVTNNQFQPPFTFDWGPVYPSALDSLSTSKWSSNSLTTGAIVPAPTGNG